MSAITWLGLVARDEGARGAGVGPQDPCGATCLRPRAGGLLMNPVGWNQMAAGSRGRGMGSGRATPQWGEGCKMGSPFACDRLS